MKLSQTSHMSPPCTQTKVPSPKKRMGEPPPKTLASYKLKPTGQRFKIISVIFTAIIIKIACGQAYCKKRRIMTQRGELPPQMKW